MNKTAKIAISLPADILRAIEKERKAHGESRSEFFRRAAGELLKQERDTRVVAAYIHGYTTIPEISEEIEAIHQAGIRVISAEPW